MELDPVGDAMARFTTFKPMPEWVERLRRDLQRSMTFVVILLGILWAAATLRRVDTGDFFLYAFVIWGALFIALLGLKVLWYNSKKRKLFKEAFPEDAANLGM